MTETSSFPSQGKGSEDTRGEQHDDTKVSAKEDSGRCSGHWGWNSSVNHSGADNKTVPL